MITHDKEVEWGMSARSAFDELLQQRLIPEFCSDPKRSLDASGFLHDTNSVTERDATDFLQAWKAGFAVHKDRGRYYICEARVLDQFFWERGKAVPGRKFSLWIEPIITMGALARLHFDLGWPKNMLVSQPDTWAFDLAASSPDGKTAIAGEVKRTRKATENMIRHMRTLGESADLTEPSFGPARNAFRKVSALRNDCAPIFWAIGPDGYEQVFSMNYDEIPLIRFIPVNKEWLRYRC